MEWIFAVDGLDLAFVTTETIRCLLCLVLHPVVLPGQAMCGIVRRTQKMLQDLFRSEYWSALA